MAQSSSPMWNEIEASLDDAIAKAGLDDPAYARRVKQLLQNRLLGQDREADLVDVLADMPLVDKEGAS